jgi:hypothetical protein
LQSSRFAKGFIPERLGAAMPLRWSEMKIRIDRIIGNGLMICTGLFLALSTPGEAATWAVYQDQTEKCRLDYASSVFALGKKDADDFQRFSGPNKDTYFRVAGLPNEEQLSPKQIRMEYIKNRGKSEIVYERTKSDFLVLSGIRNGKIFYSKVAVSPNTNNICVLHIVYPQKAKRGFDAIVTRMSRSFIAED